MCLDSQRNKDTRKAVRRHEQIIKHFSEGMEAFGFIIITVCRGNWSNLMWISTTNFQPAKQQAEQRRRLNVANRSNISTYDDLVMSDVTHNRAWQFVGMVLLLENRLHQQDPNVYKQVQVIAADGLFVFGKTLPESQALYRPDPSACNLVDIGYHNVCCSARSSMVLMLTLLFASCSSLTALHDFQSKEVNSSQIEAGGLLTKEESQTKWIGVGRR